MGINPSTFKQGGFLNGKTVTLTGYAFQRKTFENAEGSFTPQNIEFRFRIDGADEDVKTWLQMGKAEAWGNQSPDGQRLFTPNGQSLSANSQLGILLGSFIPAGAPADAFLADDSPDYLSLEQFVARRPRFILETPVNEEKTEKFGKQKGRGKNAGKEFDRRDLRVSKFFGYTAAAGQASGQTSGGSQKAVGALNSSGSGVNREAALKVVQAVVKAVGGSLPKGKLPTKVTAQVGTKDPNLEGLRKLITSVAFLESLDGEKDGLVYDGDTQTLMAYSG